MEATDEDFQALSEKGCAFPRAIWANQGEELHQARHTVLRSTRRAKRTVPELEESNGAPPND